MMSMTGYGRAEGAFEDYSWVWEVRGVNGKGLDMRLRLPSGFESLEGAIRKTVGKTLKRGNLQISLDMKSASGAGSYKINKDWLKALVDEGAALVKGGHVKPARLDGLYLVRGVVVDDTESAADPRMEARNEALMASLGDMLDAVKSARKQEGKALANIMGKNIEAFAGLNKQARTCESAQAPQIKQKLAARITELLGDDFSEDRLIQEAALIAAKADVREELDRLDAHVEAANKLLKSGVPIGRKLDFLAQEFIREINTLCSKSSDIELTNIGLEMKSLTEQFREQAANVE